LKTDTKEFSKRISKNTGRAQILIKIVFKKKKKQHKKKKSGPYRVDILIVK
jgi:hypothetical protein